MSAYILDTETTGIVDPVPVEVAWIKLELDPYLIQALS